MRVRPRPLPAPPRPVWTASPLGATPSREAMSPEGHRAGRKAPQPLHGFVTRFHTGSRPSKGATTHSRVRPAVPAQWAQALALRPGRLRTPRSCSRGETCHPVRGGSLSAVYFPHVAQGRPQSRCRSRSRCPDTDPRTREAQAQQVKPRGG